MKLFAKYDFSSIDKTNKNYTYANLICKNGNISLLEDLIKSGKNINIDLSKYKYYGYVKTSPLLVSFLYEKQECIDILIKHINLYNELKNIITILDKKFYIDCSYEDLQKYKSFLEKSFLKKKMQKNLF